MTMKSNDEMFESVLARLEAFEREKRMRKRIILSSAAFAVGTASLIGIGVFTDVMKPPERPRESSSVISATTTAVTAEQRTAAGNTAEVSSAENASSAGTAPESDSTKEPDTAPAKAPETRSSVTAVSSSAKHTSAATSAVTSAPASSYTSGTKTTAAAKAVTSAGTTSCAPVRTTTAAKTAPVTTSATTQTWILSTYIVTLPQHTTTGTFCSRENDSGTQTTASTKTAPVTTTAKPRDEMITEALSSIILPEGKYRVSGSEWLAERETGMPLHQLFVKPSIYGDKLPSELEVFIYAFKNIDPEYAVAAICPNMNNMRFAYYVNYSHNLDEVIENYNKNLKK